MKPFDPSPSAGRGVGGCTPFRMDRSRVDICAPLAGVISYAYGIPPDQIVGSSIVTKYEIRDGRPVLVRQPVLNLYDDNEDKPVGINVFIGRRPIAAFGNSDGDFAMLEWVTGGTGARFALIVHHDDAEREFSYDRDAGLARLDRGLDEGPKSETPC